MRVTRAPAVGALLLALACGPACRKAQGPTGDEPPTPVSGRVVDERGQPVAGARVGTYFGFDRDPPYVRGEMVTGDDGRFEGEAAGWLETFAVLAYADGHQRAGLAPGSRERATDLEIVLHPSVRVRARVTCSELERTPSWVSASFSRGDGPPLASRSSDDGAIEAWLPPGTYGWEIYDTYGSSREGEIELDGTERDVDFGPVDVPASFLAKHEGQVLPDWTVTEARGVPVADAQLSRYRGRWVLVEFWGHW